MGIQSAAVLRVFPGRTTTYITGTLTAFATRSARSLFLIKAGPRSETAEEHPSSSALLPSRGPVLYGLDWLVYLGGALASGFLFLWIGQAALGLPIAALIAAIIAGWASQS